MQCFELQLDIMNYFSGESSSSSACAFEVLKAIELVSVHQGWGWCNNYLIGERLWDIFRNWSKQLNNKTPGSGKRVAEVTISSAIKLTGLSFI